MREDELRSIEQRFRALVGHTNQGLFCYALDPPVRVDLAVEQQVHALRRGVLTDCNEAYARSHGRERADGLVGKRLAELTGPASEGMDVLLRTFVEKGYHVIDAPREEVTLDGSTRHLLYNVTGVVDSGALVRVWGTARDVTEGRRMEQLMAARARLIEYAFARPVADTLQRFLDEAEALTQSEIGFFCLVQADHETLSHQAWSTSTLAHSCADSGATRHGPIPVAGVWAECVRERRPVIHNDYPTLERRQGHPEGHIPLVRVLTVPVIRGDRIVAVVGLGNKRTGYGEGDVDMVRRLADLVWEIGLRLRAEEDRHATECRFQELVENSPLGIFQTTSDGRGIHANAAAAHMYGYDTPEDFLRAFGDRIPDLYVDLERRTELLRHLREDGRVTDFEIEQRRRDGSHVWVSVSCRISQPGPDGGFILDGFMLDVTERKRAEGRLREALAEITALQKKVEAENVVLRAEVRLAAPHGNIVGQSDALREVLAQAEQVAKVDSAVLVLGETGTGKHSLARAIHGWSGRAGRALVSVNCAAIPPTLIESEMFGHEKGAFTGAVSQRVGRFEAADRSTLFLDEVAELPLEVQGKLLRVLEDGHFERVGSTRARKTDVRIIAATNRDLDTEVARGRFRQDLFYRLNVFPLTLPPLRERLEDVEPLVMHFVSELSSRIGRNIEQVARSSLLELKRHSWPGNVRELRNLVERALIVSKGPVLRIALPGSAARSVEGPVSLEEGQRRHILHVLDLTGWRVRGQGGAAEILGVKPTTLESKMRRLGIERPD